MAIAAKDARIMNLVVPKENLQEALLVKGLNVYGFETLNEVTSFLQGESEYTAEKLQPAAFQGSSSLVDFSEVTNIYYPTQYE